MDVDPAPGQLAAQFVERHLAMSQNTVSDPDAMGSKLAAHGVWIRDRVLAHGEVTLDELCRELAGRGVDVHRATVARFLHGLGLSNKKKPQGKRAAKAGDRQGT